VASRQPSLALGTKVCSMATVAGGFAGSSASISMCPSSGAMCGFCVLRSAAWISTSGLSPGSSRRNSLKIASWPYTSEVLLCSVETMSPGRPSGT